jgi:hypothetical protein
VEIQQRHLGLGGLGHLGAAKATGLPFSRISPVEG